MRRDWLLRDCKTGEVLTRASSNWVMMNKETRRLSKIPDEVRAEIEHRFLDAPPVVDDDGRKLPKLDEAAADYVRSGLTPRLSDLDFNQHVNNVKYIGWILEKGEDGKLHPRNQQMTLPRNEGILHFVAKNVGKNRFWYEGTTINCHHEFVSHGGNPTRRQRIHGNPTSSISVFGIAAKRLKVWSNKAEMEFAVEVEILARVRHKNLLSLRGYCAEGQERLIVYDYMPNLGLLSHLHG